VRCGLGWGGGGGGEGAWRSVIDKTFHNGCQKFPFAARARSNFIVKLKTNSMKGKRSKKGFQ